MRPLSATALACCCLGSLLLLLVGSGLASQEAMTESECGSTRVVGPMRKLGGRQDIYATYAMKKLKDKSCRFVVTAGNGASYAVDLEPAGFGKRPKACFACDSAEGPCSSQIVEPPKETLGEDCQYRLNNFCQHVKTRKSDSTLECN